MIPSQRLLWLAALAVLPVAAVAGIVSGAALPCALAILVMALIAAFDAVRGSERVRASETLDRILHEAPVPR